MSDLTFSPEVQAAFATWQLLRNLGFQAPDIFVGIVDENLLVKVLLPATNSFVVKVGASNMPAASFEEEWLNFAEMLPDLPEPNLVSIYRRHISPMHIAQVFIKLDAMGVSIPDDPRCKPSTPTGLQN